jgi:hypothetical protein
MHRHARDKNDAMQSPGASGQRQLAGICANWCSARARSRVAGIALVILKAGKKIGGTALHIRSAAAAAEPAGRLPR